MALSELAFAWLADKLPSFDTCLGANAKRPVAAQSSGDGLRAVLDGQVAALFAGGGDGPLVSSPPPANLRFVLGLSQQQQQQQWPCSSDRATNGLLLQLGRLGAAPLADMLALLRDVYLPGCLGAQQGVPAALRSELLAGMHTFLAHLTGATHAQLGRTVLYVPADLEGAGGTAAAGGGSGGSAADEAWHKGRVQLLEALLLHWTRQIRALVEGSRSGGRTGNRSGPLAELAFWRERTLNLQQLRQQLATGGPLRASLEALERAKSPSLPPFLALAADVEREAGVAASNAAFLEALEAPCIRLAAAAPADAPPLLPAVLDAARFVWMHSPHYNTPDVMVALLRCISSAVLEHCASTVSAAAIFAGEGLEGAEAALRQCEATAAAWREAYEDAAGRVSAATPARPWAFARPAIFAHLDAFVQRCRDLQEVCAAQRQFLGPELSEIGALAGGPRAAELARAAAEVRAGFGRLMARLRGLPYDPLDVGAAAWYEDVAAFRAGARDLEALLAGVLERALGEAATLAARLDVLCAFAAAATRNGLRKAIEARTSEWHAAFMSELASARAMFEVVKATGAPPGLAAPPTSGRVACLRGLLRRIERSWDALQGAAGALPAVPLAAESAAAYEALHAGLQQQVNTLASAFFAGVDRDLLDKLQEPLLRQDRAAAGLLATSLPEAVAHALGEGGAAAALRLGVPGAAQDLLGRRGALHALHGALAQGVVKPYNATLGALGREGRALLRDRLRQLDRRVLPGVNKLSWASPPHQTAFYVKDAARACRDAAAVLARLQAADAEVAHACGLLRDTLLVRVDKGRVFELQQFAAHQEEHQAAMRERLGEAYASLRSKLVALHSSLASDGDDVQREWLAYLGRADAALLEAAAAMVRKSLHVLSRALGGERGRGGSGSSEVPPLFQLALTLDGSTGRVELTPPLQALFDTVHGVGKGAVAALAALPRLPADVLAACADAAAPVQLAACLREAPEQAPYVEAAGHSEEAIAKQMQAGVASVVEKVQTLLLYFEKKYRVIWENERDAYLRRYERAAKPPSAYISDVERFRELADQVLGEDSAAVAAFLRLDCSSLKQTLVAECEAWASRFAQQIYALAGKQLAELREALAEPAAALAACGAGAGSSGGASSASSSGVEACASGGGTGGAGMGPAELRALAGRLEGERDDLEARVSQCQERFAALASLHVAVLGEEAEAAQSLPAAWKGFVAALRALPRRAAELEEWQQSHGGGEEAVAAAEDAPVGEDACGAEAAPEAAAGDGSAAADGAGEATTSH